MDYLKSTGVNVFPSSLREGSYSKGKFTSEYNLTRFFKAVTDADSFVIAGPYDDLDKSDSHYNASTYIFVLHGFYFEVSKTAVDEILDASTPTALWAHIRVDDDGRLISWLGGTNLDITSSEIDRFQALYFDTSKDTSKENSYSIDLLGSDKFIKFNSDVFKVNNKTLDEALDAKQDKITTTNQLDLSADAGLVKNILPEENGGTGKTSLQEVTVGSAEKLVDDNEVSLNVGDEYTPVYFKDGMPSTVTLVKEASRLSSAKDTALNRGSTTKPVYFSNGVPTSMGDTIDAYAKGISTKTIGKKDVTDVTNMQYTSVYVNDYTVTEGITIHISTGSPTNTTGNVGDLWFKYTAD